MVKVEGKAVVTIDGQEAGKQLETLQTKASELRKRILEIEKEKIIDNEKIKLISKNLNEAETNVSDFKIKLAELHSQDIIDKTKIAEVSKELAIAKQKVKEFKTELEATSKNKAIELYNAELKQTEKQINQVKTSTFTYQQVLKNLDGSSLKDLQKAHKLLNTEVEKLERNTEEYVLKSKQLKTIGTTINSVKSEMKGVNEVAGKTPGLISKISDGFNKYSGVALGVIASLTGIVLGFRQVVTVFNDYEEKVDNLSALTGLAGEQLEWLSDEARYLATSTTDAGVKITQGAGAIVDAFTSVGSKRPELLADAAALKTVTEDAIILSQAAKTELDPAVTALTTTLNQFNLKADQSSRAINSIAAGSKVGAGDIPYISQAMEKAGTQAHLMGVSLEEVVGAIETVAPYWTEAATAGNSLEKVFMTLKAKQIGYTDGVFNLQDAISELETRYAAGETAVEIFSKEHAKMGEILVANKETLATYTEQVTGTNVAIEQATINSNNNAAALAQAKNRVEENSIILGEKLAPALTFSTNAFSYLMKVLIAIIANWDTFKKYLITGVAAVVFYSIAIEGATIAKKAYSLAVSLAEKTHKLFNSTVKANPVGLLVATLATVVVALIAFKDRLAESSKTVRDFNNDLITEKTSLNNVFEALKKTNPGTEERKALIEKINTTYSEYLPKLLDEKSNLYDITQAQLLANKALEQSLALKYQVIAQEEVIGKAIETRTKYSSKILEDLNNPELYSVASADFDKLITKAIEFGKIDPYQNFEPLNDFWTKYSDELDNYTKSSLKVMLNNIIDAENTKNSELTRINSIFNSYKTETDSETYNQELMALKKDLLNKLITEEEYWIKKAELETKYNKTSTDATSSDVVTVTDDYTDTEPIITDNSAEEKTKAETELAKYIKEINKELLEDEKSKALEEIEIWNETEQAKINESVAAKTKKDEALVALELLHQKKISDLEVEYNAKKQDAIQTVNDFLLEKENTLATERQKIIDNEIEKIKAEYQEKIDLLLEYDDTQEEIALLEKSREDEIAAYKIQKEKEFAAEIYSIREEYGLVTNEEFYQNELVKLEDYYLGKLISEEDYEAAKLKLKQDFLDKQAEAEAKALEITKQQRIDEFNDYTEKWQNKQAVIEAYGNFFSSAKDLELKISENNYNADIEKFGVSEKSKANITEKYEKEKKEIEKRYALVSLTISSAKAITNGAVAITKALAELGPIAGPIAAVAIGAETAIQIAAAENEYTTVMGLETGGNFPVIRQQDGKKFNADFEPHKRGYISKPTVLVGENNKLEYVVSNEALQNPVISKTIDIIEIARRTGSLNTLDFPKIISAQSIVKGFETGGYTSGNHKSNSQTSENEIDYSIILVSILTEMRELKNDIKTQNQKIDNWQKYLKVDYYSFETAVNEVEKLKADTSIKR